MYKNNHKNLSLLSSSTTKVRFFFYSALGIFVILLLNCASTPRYKRNTAEIPKKTAITPKKTIKTPSPSSKPVPTSSIKSAKSDDSKPVIKRAYAPEMRIPSEPILPQKNEHPRFEYYQRGKASFYANKFNGRKTANGEQYDKNALTAAHKKLPFNSIVKVTNILNNKTVIVRINDRGPYSKGRVIDISRAAAQKIGMISNGVVDVTIEIVRNGK